jgi:hypothetical protein
MFQQHLLHLLVLLVQYFQSVQLQLMLRHSDLLLPLLPLVQLQQLRPSLLLHQSHQSLL